MGIENIKNLKKITIKKQELTEKVKSTYPTLKFKIETEEGEDHTYMLIVYHNHIPEIEKNVTCLGMKVRSIDAFCFNNQIYNGDKPDGKIKKKKGFATYLESVFEEKKIKVSKKAKKTQKTSLYQEMFGDKNDG